LPDSHSEFPGFASEVTPRLRSPSSDSSPIFQPRHERDAELSVRVFVNLSALAQNASLVVVISVAAELEAMLRSKGFDIHWLTSKRGSIILSVALLATTPMKQSFQTHLHLYCGFSSTETSGQQ
jgi:hypothetical protein